MEMTTKKSYQDVKSMLRGQSKKSTKIVPNLPIKSNNGIDWMVPKVDIK